jgi:hypothetical protein
MNQSTAKNYKKYDYNNKILFFLIIFFTYKLNRTLDSGQSVQILADWVQFPHEISQSKHSKSS